MFRAFRILQVATLGVLAGGCAATHLATPATRSAPARTASLAPIPAPPPISAGSSVNSTEGFVDSAGNLQPEIRTYARAVSAQRNVPLPEVEALLRDAQYNATVVRLSTPRHRHVRRSWVTYRKRFVDPIRIRDGIGFWKQHKAFLDATAASYGVPQSILVAIIGVETVYGRQTGNFRVLDALATLGFRNPDTERPQRSAMFRDQLADLIQLDNEKKVDARTLEGSYAGAVGLPQFMPGSLIRFAVDGNHDGVVDVRGEPNDAIASVANYLRQHGWVPGLPVFAPVILPKSADSLATTTGLQPDQDWPHLKSQGATIRHGAGSTRWTEYPLGVIDLVDEPRNLDEYRTATPNFFAITHYNHSYFYAASVADLAQAIADSMGYGGPNQAQ